MPYRSASGTGLFSGVSTSSRTHRLRLVFVCAAGAAALLVATTITANAAPTSGDSAGGRSVVTVDGSVRGKTVGATREFLGLPYAAPPVGTLRWQPPHPPAPWQGVREATAFAPHCPQPASPFGVASTSEDCLYLNVYTPANLGSDTHKAPVMVWIHGGAFNWGESNDYNPSALVARGDVVVTLNYRLGALGFLADKGLTGPGGSSGDYGLMDQQAALRWVKTNIASFGGAPYNVTVAGESSGGLSVLSQLASPGGHGLFSRAISESGAYDLTPTSLDTAEQAGATFATAAGCADQTRACLDKLPIGTILADENPAGYRPDIDGSVLPQALSTAFAKGQFNRVPVINGTNHDEYRLFVGLSQLRNGPVTATNYQDEIAAVLSTTPAQAAAIAAVYPLSSYPSPSLALGAVGTDAMFACPALSADNSLSRYVPTYAYEFNDSQAPQLYLPALGFPYGAAHESEVQYLFALTNTANPSVLSPQQLQLASTMKKYWSIFAKTGAPSPLSEPHWPAFSAGTTPVLSLNTPTPTVETSFSAEHDCSFWAANS
jgi:para-nitrobenzyl esterase